VGYQTYLAFIAIQCLGFFIGSLLSNPEKVQRKDGTQIAAPKGTNWRVELREMWRLARSKSILLLVPLFWYYGWCQAYPGTYLATYFTVRSRALGSLSFAISGTFGTWLAGALVDVPWVKSRQTRAIVTYVIIASLNSGSWIWAVYIQNEFRHTKPTLDWANQVTFGRGFGLYVFERVSVSMVRYYSSPKSSARTNHPANIHFPIIRLRTISIGTCPTSFFSFFQLPNILGSVANHGVSHRCISNLSDSPGDQIRYSSLLRGIETAAVCLGFGIQAIPTPLIATASINCGLWFFALPFSYFATVQVVRKFKELEKSKAPEGFQQK
jgi:hypothetical protein